MALANSYAESIVALITGQDVEVSLHTADPGKTGANEADITQSNGRVSILTADWNAAVDDGPTTGRLQDNVNELDFGNATADESVTHIFFWESDGTTPIGGFALVDSKTLVTGEPVKMPAGDLDVVGAGA